MTPDALQAVSDPTSAGLDTSMLGSGIEHSATGHAHHASGASLPSGFEGSNHLPTAEAAKLSQKAHDDYLHGYIESGSIERDGKISPIRHALNKFKEAGWAGGTTMALFGSVLGIMTFAAKAILGSMATTSVTAAGETLATIAGVSVGTLAMPLAIITTGIVWYGGKAALQAYRDANEHNHKIEDIAKSPSKALARALHKEQSIDLSDLPEKELTSVVAAPVFIIAEPEISQSRPDFLDNILKSGPKNLSPKELAAQIEAERAGQSVAI